MARPPKHSVDFKARVVVRVLSSEMSAAEAARRHGVSETSVARTRSTSPATSRRRTRRRGERSSTPMRRAARRPR
jgi:transposase-like protein